MKKPFILPGRPYERKEIYVPHCYYCKRDVDIVIDDGDFGLCEDCARHESNRIYNKLLSTFEAEEQLSRMAFAKYGIDDFAYVVDEEINNG